MALKPQGNNILAGTSLAIAQIQSPGFIAGSSGWIIRQDGSAEFNNIVIRGGTIQGGIALYYSSTPAAGNLVASIAAAGGTDSFGNNYVAGAASYAATFATAVNGGQIVWYAGSLSAGWSSVATATSHATSPQGLLINANAELVLSNSAGSAGLTLGTSLGGNVTALSGAVFPITAAVPGSGNTIEVWNAMTPLLNSWTATAGRVAPQYRQVASPPHTFEVIGSVTAPAGLAGASNIWAIPTAYQLTDGPQPLVARNASTNAVVMLSAASGAGDLSYQAGAVAGNVIDFHGFFSQDA